MFEIGTSLREARLRQGLDFPELEQGTKIRAKYLRALEDEQFDVLPAQTYVKGFLRSYAEYLGLDGQLYVDEYNSRFVVGEEEQPSRPRRSAPPPRGVQVQSRVVLLTLLGIAAVTALVIVAWTRGEPQKVPPVGLGSTQTPTPQTPAKPAGATNTVRLIVRAKRGPCWLSVHRGSATGSILFQGTLDQGQDQIFRGRRLWITLDRPENLLMILNGRTRLLPVGGVKTLIVTPRSIRPAV
ncbi:MAG: helix-turn-helix domain-containing protein [Actinobacteria bacterium]|nr:MAG: helix-turn-helix domain-containing protein [Actinomycetota bacterium]